MPNGAAGHTSGAKGIWKCNRRGQPHGPSPTAGSPPTGYGTIAWDDAMNLPGSAQVGFGKKLLEQFAWQDFKPHPEWAKFEDGDAKADDPYAPQATGIADGVRVIYVPEAKAIVVQKLDAKINYAGRLFDPVTGKITDLPKVRSNEAGDAKFAPPANCDHDWVLILQP